MKTYLYFILILLSTAFASAAIWYNNPLSCPNNYQSQTCSGSDLVCGYNGGVTFCYNMALLSPPASTVRSVTDQDSGSYNGGYLIDCTAYDGTAPHCDNAGSYWCDRNSTCYNVARQTNCTASAWSASFCDTSCVSGYTFCDGSLTDGDGCEVQSGVTNCAAGNNNNQNSACACVCDTGYLDCDASGNGTGNGCEVQNGGSCSVGSLTGTYSGCTCVVSKSYFQTGTFTEYQTNTTQGGMLWFKDYYVNALLINATNYYNQSWTLNASGCIKYLDDTTSCTAATGGNMSGNLNMVNQNITNIQYIYANITCYVANCSKYGFYNTTSGYYEIIV